MIRIAFVLPSFAGGGAERVIITVANALDRTVFQPRLIVLEGSGPLADLVAADVAVTVLERPRLRTALPALRRTLLAEPTDIALSTLGYLNVGLLALRPTLPRRIRLVVREANMPLSGTGGHVRRVLGLGMRQLYRSASCVLCPATRIADELVNRYRVSQERIQVIPNPVDSDRLRMLADPPRRHPGRGLRMVAAGRLVEQKGYKDLIALMATLPRDTHLAILGDGPLRNALASQIEDAGLTENVALHGFVSTPWPYYAGADVFVLPSLWEGLPNVVLEALAVGTPVIATPEAGGISEIADTTSPGAITIAARGERFRAAIAERTSLPQGARPSLLPDVFGLHAVVVRYQTALEELM